jgi:hypothetical protein
MRLTSLTALPRAVAWIPVHNIASMMPSKLHPWSKSHPLISRAPAGSCSIVVASTACDLSGVLPNLSFHASASSNFTFHCFTKRAGCGDSGTKKHAGASGSSVFLALLQSGTTGEMGFQDLELIPGERIHVERNHAHWQWSYPQHSFQFPLTASISCKRPVTNDRQISITIAFSLYEACKRRPKLLT